MLDEGEYENNAVCHLSVGTREIIPSKFRESVNMPGKLQVQVSLPATDFLHINVYDIMGKIIYHANMKCADVNNILDFSIGPAGMYVVGINGSTFKVMGSDQNITCVRLLQDVSISRLKSDTVIITKNSKNYFDYNNDPALGAQYGKLYTARSALDVDSPPYPDIIQGICPNGWHVPNDSDWLKLEIAAGMTKSTASGWFRYRGTISNKLKVVGPEWYFGEGKDIYGFSAKGSGFYGCRYQGCYFYLLREYCTWWTYNINDLMIRQLSDWDAGVWRGYFTSDNGAQSVRCVKDQ
ncbi:MAG: FISUMP domain-containing protein [Bacteroidales bacterium]|nr:hypothetical protein [Bacteroidales bacterium]MDD4604286.1 FISUMP domain-containing protein [Bacteroidales bacterium]